jgi:hypothetical protein
LAFFREALSATEQANMNLGGSMPEMGFRPLVTSATTAKSLNVGSLLDDMEDGRVKIPNFQRDSAQWDIPKRSLFVESLINGLAIPPVIVYPENDPITGLEINNVIDGQQRITTIREFTAGKFALSNEDDAEYAENVGPLIQGKYYSELPHAIQKQIRMYPLNFIVLPKDLDPNLRLNIFRRINEGGVPLSAQDLRLAEFGGCPEVCFVRLAGIFSVEGEGAKRMLSVAQETLRLEYPWNDAQAWRAWWLDTRLAVGQASSEMFLYYVVARDRKRLEQLLSSEKAQQNLRLKNDGTTACVLDLYCAQLMYQSREGSTHLLVEIDELRNWFKDFEVWFNVLKQVKVPKLPLNSSTKIAFFIAAASELWRTPNTLSESQWERVQVFLTSGPSKILEVLGKKFPTSKGKWRGQYHQLQATYEICRLIKGS